jgi:hypothetical protein
MIDLLRSVDLDTALLRHELVGLQWLAREHGIYWRVANGAASLFVQPES